MEPLWSSHGEQISHFLRTPVAAREFSEQADEGWRDESDGEATRDKRQAGAIFICGKPVVARTPPCRLAATSPLPEGGTN